MSHVSAYFPFSRDLFFGQRDPYIPNDQTFWTFQGGLQAKMAQQFSNTNQFGSDFTEFPTQ